MNAHRHEDIIAELGQLQVRIASTLKLVSDIGLFQETAMITHEIQTMQEDLQALDAPDSSLAHIIASVASKLDKEKEKALKLVDDMKDDQASRVAAGFVGRTWTDMMRKPVPWETKCSCCSARCPEGRSCMPSPGDTGYVICEGRPVGHQLREAWDSHPAATLALPSLVVVICAWCFWPRARPKPPRSKKAKAKVR
uniref:Uncharacterized protein n=1 Tax=Coccolithus braarudii TaxID=221442 RepID=A0A7S0LEW8_9EUKA